MKPWYMSKKLWSAVVTGVTSAGAALITHYLGGSPELAATLAGSITLIGGSLVIAIGQADKGKEAAAIMMNAKEEK